MDDDLYQAAERIKKIMAEPLPAPVDDARDPEEFYQWLLKKQGEYRRKGKEHDAKGD